MTNSENNVEKIVLYLLLVTANTLIAKLYANCMRHIMMLWQTSNRIYDGGPT